MDIGQHMIILSDRIIIINDYPALFGDKFVTTLHGDDNIVTFALNLSRVYSMHIIMYTQEAREPSVVHYAIVYVTQLVVTETVIMHACFKHYRFIPESISLSASAWQFQTRQGTRPSHGTKHRLSHDQH